MNESTIPLYASQPLLPLSGVRFELSHAKEFFNPGKDVVNPPHIHNCVELFLNISSDASFLVNNRLYPLLYGDVILSKPNDIHVCLFNKSYTHEHFCLWIDEDAPGTLFPFLHEQNSSALFRFEEERRQQLIDLFFELHRLCENAGSVLEKTACFLKILSFFEHPAVPQRQETQMPDTLQLILDDIHENFAEIHHVNQLTDKYFVSHATLSRWFREHLHTSPREYLESKKLAHAVKLLSNGETVTEACMQAGFPCCSHFIVLFKKKFGETPLKYKKHAGTRTP